MITTQYLLSAGTGKIDSVDLSATLPSMSTRIPGLDQASVEEKFALLDEVWESVRRSDKITLRDDHLSELEKRVAAVNADPAIALTPVQARALLRK